MAAIRLVNALHQAKLYQFIKCTVDCHQSHLRVFTPSQIENFYRS